MKRILAVDDEQDITDLLKLYLESLGGYEVKTENDPTQVVQTARTFGPDLILLDVMMPVIDGSELAARIVNDVHLKGTPIVFLTALVSQQETVDGSFVRGSRTYFPKPIDWVKLVACIKRMTGANPAGSLAAPEAV